MNRFHTLSKWLFCSAIAMLNLSQLVYADGEKESAVPAIVVVRSYDTATSDAKPADERLGFIVESRGLILTSHEVLVDSKTETIRPAVTVELVGGGRRYSAAVVSVEPTLNFAILKADSDKPFPESKLCSREKIKVGQKVRAFAGMKEGKPVYNSGQISDLNSKECYQFSMTATMLRAQIEIPNASIGGPVFNEQGEVVAVYTGHVPSHSPDQAPTPFSVEELDELDDLHSELEELNESKLHILPIFLVSNIYDSLKSQKSLKSPWTGFSVRRLTEEERKLFPYDNVRRFSGAVGVEAVWKGGPAEKLGVLKDDLLLSFSYYKTKSVAEFQKWLYAHAVGMEVKLYFLRGGKELRTLPYVIEERPKWAIPR